MVEVAVQLLQLCHFFLGPVWKGELQLEPQFLQKVSFSAKGNAAIATSRTTLVTIHGDQRPPTTVYMQGQGA